MKALKYPKFPLSIFPDGQCDNSSASSPNEDFVFANAFEIESMVLQAFNVSNGNLDTDSSSGMPAPSNFFSNQPSEYTGSPLIITSDQMGVGNASEIDAVKVTIAFPSLISQKETGKKGEGYAEYRIQFGYKRGNFVGIKNLYYRQIL